MAANPNIMNFVQRFQDLQQHTDTSESIIKDLIIYCESIESTLRMEKQNLTQELRDCKLDLSDAVKTRRELQQRVQICEESIQAAFLENDSLKNRNPYVCLLIDGDGLIFQEKWIKQGIEGGKRAAYALRAAVAERCVNKGKDVEIITKVIANLGGLGRAMQRDGCLDHSSDMKEFTLGFTQAKATFDFIDVGYGKERADSKIKELTRWNLQNHNCKQVLLGISHDAGYAPFLDEILQDETTRKRVTVLEGVATVPELIATNVERLSLTDDLFRSEKLVDRTNVQRVMSAPTPVPVSAPARQVSPVTSVVRSSAAPAVQPVSQPTPKAPAVSSYATATKSATPPLQLVIPLAAKLVNAVSRPRQQQQQQQPSWNPGPRGLDSVIDVDQQLLDGLKRRKDADRFCNNHYLRGPCLNNICPFNHDNPPSKEEKKAIAKLARLNPCDNGQDCQLPECIYGHHCPSLREVGGSFACLHPFCKFPEELHPPGTKYKISNARNGYY